MQIPKWEPLVIPKAELDTGKAFKATFENLKVYHAIDFQMKDLKVAIDENSIDLKIFFPKIKLVADYTMVGRILILELNGKGEGIGNLSKFLISHLNYVSLFNYYTLLFFYDL